VIASFALITVATGKQLAVQIYIFYDVDLYKSLTYILLFKPSKRADRNEIQSPRKNVRGSIADAQI
jgi:hypothetical protein